MAKVSTNISIDAETKVKAQTLLSDFGMDLSTAVNIFLKQMVRDNAFPFIIQREVPSAETIEAMNELKEFEKHPEKFKRYAAFSDLRKEVEANNA